MHIANFTNLERVPNSTPYFRFPRLSKNKHLTHGVFTRHGGISAPPFDSLNISDSVGDRHEHVKANRKKIQGIMNARHLIQVKQVHGNDILVLERSNLDMQHVDATADAMITDVPQVALMVKQADCQSVIIYDAENRVVANVHCGWRGNTLNVLEQVVTRMEKGFRCKKNDLQASIGPSLGPCCAEFTTYKEIFPETFERFRIMGNHFDLWAASCWQLETAGLRPKNIEVAGICTRCHTDLFFSYRAAQHTGRFGTVAMLTSKTFG